MNALWAQIPTATKEVFSPLPIDFRHRFRQLLPNSFVVIEHVESPFQLYRPFDSNILQKECLNEIFVDEYAIFAIKLIFLLDRHSFGTPIPRIDGGQSKIQYISHFIQNDFVAFKLLQHSSLLISQQIARQEPFNAPLESVHIELPRGSHSCFKIADAEPQFS